MRDSMNEITGKTKLYAIVADPILQVKTPQNLNRLFAQRGIDAVMVPMHVPADGLEGWVAAMRGVRNLGGMVVTVPHKTAIARLCDALTPAAAMVGAVNVVRREPDGKLVGDILDGRGFVAGLRASGIEPAGKRAYLAGAGGAASAIAFSLAEAGVSLLTIHNRTQSKAQEILSRLRVAYPGVVMQAGSDDPSGHDLVVNATSLGMAENDPYPLDVTALTSDQTVAEIIMRPEMTPLLIAAQRKGCTIQLGMPMLTGQVELMAQFMGAL